MVIFGDEVSIKSNANGPGTVASDYQTVGRSKGGVILGENIFEDFPAMKLDGLPINFVRMKALMHVARAMGNDYDVISILGEVTNHGVPVTKMIQ